MILYIYIYIYNKVIFVSAFRQQVCNPASWLPHANKEYYYN